MQKRPIISRSLLIAATPYHLTYSRITIFFLVFCVDICPRDKEPYLLSKEPYLHVYAILNFDKLLYVKICIHGHRYRCIRICIYLFMCKHTYMNMYICICICIYLCVYNRYNVCGSVWVGVGVGENGSVGVWLWV